MTAQARSHRAWPTGVLANLIGLAVVCQLLVTGPRAIQAQEIPSIEDKTAGMTAMEGFFDLYWDESAGKLYWEIAPLDTEFLYLVSMASGLGSNPVGIDRGQLGGTYLLTAKKIGPRVLLMEPNYQYRAESDNPEEVKAVEEAFAPSVHWGFEVAAQTGDRVLVDGTDFFLRDARRVVDQIASRGQGTFRLDASRSALYPDAILSFADNTEVEAILTFTSDDPGPLVRGVAASGEAITLRQHHSFVRLPDDGYAPRVTDPRVGTNGPTIYDYATPIDQDLRLRWVARHRLEKRDPTAERSEAVEPIVYYLDPGVPEPIRSALLEGAEWWNQAFEAAGYIDAFRVAVLPDGAHPQDIRYNMIHWTHRRTRGYSYGSSVVDPRTGEIIKGNVNLGSLRLRQDYLHGQGVLPPFPAGQGMYYESCGLADAPGFEYLAQVAGDADAVEMALARVRQLSAHEVGHTLGFPHNYLASAYGRESVMDYPAPLVEIADDGTIDLSNAYLRRIGDYDKLSVTWLYQDFPAGTDESAALREITEEGMEQGLFYMGHTNNNFRGAGHQYAGVWDNGDNLVDHLKTEIEVRRIGLESFGPEVIRPGEPLSNLEQVLLPLYMHHRFQLNSAVQSVGGADYAYALRGDGQTPYTIVPADEQRDALETVLSTLTVDFLAMPEQIVEMIPPPAFRYGQGEVFDGYTELLFDPLGAAEGAAAFAVEELLRPERMARLVVFGAMGDYPNLEEVVDRLVDHTWSAPEPDDEYRMRVLHTIQRVVADEMMVKAARDDVSAEVRAILADRLGRLADSLEAQPELSPHQRLVTADIRRWENRSEATIPGPKLEIPPGDPIGSPGN
jgi:hypothetical protein